MKLEINRIVSSNENEKSDVLSFVTRETVTREEGVLSSVSQKLSYFFFDVHRSRI